MNFEKYLIKPIVRTGGAQAKKASKEKKISNTEQKVGFCKSFIDIFLKTAMQKPIQTKYSFHTTMPILKPHC